jgi:uncharacterized membrane protein
MEKELTRRNDELAERVGEVRCMANLGPHRSRALGWIITGSAVQTTAIALIYNAVHTPAFYLHERWWERHRDKASVRETSPRAAAPEATTTRTRANYFDLKNSPGGG